MRAFALCSLVLAVSACKIDDPFDTLTSITGLLTDSTTDATASAGTTSGGSSGDVTASGGSTGDVPTTGSSNSDSATSQGSTGEPGTSTTTAGTTTTAGSTGGGTTGGGGADAYGPCEMSNPPCPDGSDCVQIQGIEGNFCSPQCGMADCPDFAGTAQPMCVLQLGMAMSPTNCALICDPNGNDCPMGSTCKPVPMQSVGLCTYP